MRMLGLDRARRAALHLPSIVVQAGQTKAGMPVGVQIVRPWNGEARLFDFAGGVEQALGGFVVPTI